MAQGNGANPPDDPAPRLPIDWEAWAERGPPPPRDWAIEQWIGLGHVTLLAGLGGSGKSSFIQQCCTAIALGRPFIAAAPLPRVCLAWMGEDDEHELVKRQIAINKKFDVGLDAIRGRVTMYALDNADVCLLDVIQGRLERTSNLKALHEQIGDLKAEFVVIDNIARAFGGNENDRHHVSSFYAALQWAAAPTKAAILLIGHAAKLAGSEYAGSTAWENAARARLWFSDKPPDKKENGEDEENVDQDLRYCSKRKVNYTSRDLVVLRYTDHAYDVVTAPSGGGLVASIDRNRCKGVLLASITKLGVMGLPPNESTSSPHYLPRLVIEHGFAEGFTRHELTLAMRHLMGEGVLKRTQVGQNANRTPRYGLVVTNGPPAP